MLVLRNELREKHEEGKGGQASEPDELDSWFDGSEEEEEQVVPEGQSADETEEEVEDTSSLPSPEEDSPDTETPKKDAEKASSKGTSVEPDKDDDPYAWVNELDPDLRKRAEALVQGYRSNSGRVAALQHRLDKEAARREAAAATAADRRSKPAVEGGSADTEDEGLKSFSEDYPTVAENVQKMVDARVAAQVAAQVNPLREQQVASERLKAKEALRANAQRIFNSAETGIQLEDVLQSDAWKTWMDSQPDGYRKFARTSSSADDATKVLEDFAQYAQRQAYEDYIASGASGPDPDPNEDEGNADQVVARRRQALTGSAPRSKTDNSGNNSKSTYEDWFDHYAEGGK